MHLGLDCKGKHFPPVALSPRGQADLEAKRFVLGLGLGLEE